MSKLRPRRRLRRLRSMSADQRLLRTRRPPATTPQRLPLRLSSDPFASNFGCHAAWWRAPVSPPAPNRISTVRLVAYRFDSSGSLALFEPVVFLDRPGRPEAAGWSSHFTLNAKLPSV